MLATCSEVCCCCCYCADDCLERAKILQFVRLKLCTVAAATEDTAQRTTLTVSERSLACLLLCAISVCRQLLISLFPRLAPQYLLTLQSASQRMAVALNLAFCECCKAQRKLAFSNDSKLCFAPLQQRSCAAT